MKYVKGNLLKSEPNTKWGGIWVQIKPETEEEKKVFGAAPVKIWERSIEYNSSQMGPETAEWQKLRDFLQRDPLEWALEEYNKLV